MNFWDELGHWNLLPGLHTRRSPLTHLGVPPPGEIWDLGEEAEVRCAVLASWCFLSRWGKERIPTGRISFSLEKEGTEEDLK